MQLHHIKEEVCSNCGARTCCEEQSSQHACGEWFEAREFTCGRKIAWSPNFSRLEARRECGKDPEEIKKIEKRQEASQAVARFIQSLDVDAQYKDLLLGRVIY